MQHRQHCENKALPWAALTVTLRICVCEDRNAMYKLLEKEPITFDTESSPGQKDLSKGAIGEEPETNEIFTENLIPTRTLNLSFYHEMFPFIWEWTGKG